MPIQYMNNNIEYIPKGNEGGDMKKTRQPTEVAKTLSGGNAQEDTVAKRLFSINEIIAWILKLCVEEFSAIDV